MAINSRQFLKKLSSSDSNTEFFLQKQYRRDIYEQLKLLSRVSAVIVTLIGVMVLVGWATQNETLKALFPTLPSMKTNTALCFVLLGIALWICQSEKTHIILRLLKNVAASTVLCIGLATLFQYIFTINLGIDEFIFKEALGALGTTFPNRMGPNSSILFSLSGLSLLLLNKKQARILPSQLLMVIAGFVLLPTIIGYLYGLDFIYGIETATKIALHTAVGFICLVIGIITARPLNGFMSIILKDDAGGYLARRLLIWSVIVPLLLGWIILQGYKMNIYGTNLQFLLLVAVYIGVFTFLIWRNAFDLSLIDRKRKKAEDNAVFLFEATNVLNTSLDYEQTLKKISKIIVPTLADWIIIDLITDVKHVERVLVMHSNKKFDSLSRKLQKKFPPDLSLKYGVPQVIRSGRSIITPDVPDETLQKSAHSHEHYQILKKLGFSSGICLALKVGGRVVGAMTLVYGKSGRKYSDDDFVISRELGNRIAVAIENTLLYRKAQIAINIRDEFLSLASHELKTPLTSLKMYTQVLGKRFKRKGEEEAQQYMVKVDSQIDKLTGLIKDLLDVSRVRFGRLEYHMAPFNLNTLIQETVESLQLTAKKNVIQIDGESERDVWGDKDRIGQVLTNLLTNAIKYSPESVPILVKVISRKNSVEVSVQDFGPGIDKSHQSKIFERFYRVQSKNEKTFPGLGIGLYISNEIMKRHARELQVESKKGEGAIFSFSLRYAQAT